MTAFEHRMNFEQERLAEEKAQAFHDRLAEILDGNDSPTPHELIAAIGRVQDEMDPNRGELVYELNDDQ